MTEATAEKEPVHWLTILTRDYFVGVAALIVLSILIISPAAAGELAMQFLMFGLGLAAVAWGVTARSIIGKVIAGIGATWMVLMAVMLVAP